MLSDSSLRKASAFLDPSSSFDLSRLQPASYDVTLGSHFLEMTPSVQLVDVEDPSSYDPSQYRVVPSYAGSDGEFSVVLRAGQFMLAHTAERFRIPSNIQAQVCGKSSLGRLGLFVENAGFVDPGFEGQLTLELFNCSARDVVLRSGMRVAQIAFQQLDRPAGVPYGSLELGSHYQGQEGAVPSRGSF